MTIGILQLELRIPDADSRKDKRRVVLLRSFHIPMADQLVVAVALGALVIRSIKK